MTPRLALHTWTLDTTPLEAALGAVRGAGWDAVELRRLDFTRAADAGRTSRDVLEVVRASGLAVACVGAEHGWMWAEGAERRRLLEIFAEQCARAGVLGCTTVMSPVDRGMGDVRRATASVREVGDLAAAARVRLAVEFNSQADQLNSLSRIREVLAAAAHPACGLLLDTYHLHRSGGRPRSVTRLVPAVGSLAQEDRRHPGIAQPPRGRAHAPRRAGHPRRRRHLPPRQPARGGQGRLPRHLRDGPVSRLPLGTAG